jgi:type 1 glutamine amidotransferase
MFVQAALAAALLAPAPAQAVQAPKTVLVVSEARGYVHASIPAARAALRRLEGPGIDVQEVPAQAVTAARLRTADAVVLAVTTGDLPVDRTALRRFVRRGGGLAGFHSATDTFASWPGWEALIGGRFVRHEEPGATETARVTAPGHPAVHGVPARFRMREEWYLHEPGVARRARVLVRWGAERRPLVWARTPGRGRVFYDALGHFPTTWQDPRQRALVRSGLRWVLRLP